MTVKQDSGSFSERHRKFVIIIAAFVSAMGIIDATALNVALPFIQSSLNAPTADVHWVLEIYLLFLAALMMAGGALGDTLGRRRPLRWGIMAFALSSVGCALANSTETLIFYRALQGIASALMLPASLALINAGFPPPERAAAIGKWSAIMALAIPLGPLVGGLAVDFLSWHYVFFLNVPLCLLCLALLAFLPRPPFEPPEPQPLDIPGSVTITTSLGLLTYALLEAGRNGSFTLFQVMLLLIGTALLFVFFTLEARLKSPMLPSSLLRDRRFVLVSVQTFMLFAGFQSAMYFLSFLFIQSYGYSALEAGVASVPIPIIVSLVSPRAGRYVSQHGPRGILCVSSVLMGISLLWLSFTTGDYLSSVLPGMVILGFAVGFFAAPLTAVAMVSAGPGRDGLASGVNNAVARIGPLLGIAVFGYWIGGDYAKSLSAALELSSFTTVYKDFLIDNKAMMAAVDLPTTWPETVTQNVFELVRTLFADSVRTVLRISALFAFVAAGLALLYRREDAKQGSSFHD